LKRFDEYNQGGKQNQTPSNTETKPVNQNIKTLDQTKKHLGFHWNTTQ